MFVLLSVSAQTSHLEFTDAVLSCRPLDLPASNILAWPAHAQESPLKSGHPACVASRQTSQTSSLKHTRAQFENNYLSEMCAGSEECSYLRLTYFVSLSSRLESDEDEDHSA